MFKFTLDPKSDPDPLQTKIVDPDLDPHPRTRLYNYIAQLELVV